MTLWTCIRAFGDHRPGDQVELPDDAAMSELHYAAGLEDPEAHPAVVARRAEDEARSAESDSAAADGSGEPSSAPAPETTGAAAVAAPAPDSAPPPSGGN